MTGADGGVEHAPRKINPVTSTADKNRWFGKKRAMPANLLIRYGNRISH